MQSAKSYLEKKDYEAAIIELQNAVAATPKNAEAQYQLAVALLASGSRLPQAVKYLTDAADLDPSHAGARLKLAELLGREKDPKLLALSEQYALAALALRPDDPDVLHALAVAEWHLDKSQSARENLKQALARNPAHPQSAATLARLQWTVDQDPAGAEKTFREAVERWPNSADALVALGRFYNAIGKPDEAEAQFQRAIGVDPQGGAALLELSKLQQKAGKQSEVEATLRRLSLSPDKAYRAEAQNRLIDLYLETARTDEAEKVVSATQKLDPRDSTVLVQRARILLAKSRFEEARKSAAEAVRSDPNSARAQYVLAKAQYGLGNLAAFREELKVAVEKDPELIQARLELSESLRKANSFREALDVIESAPPAQKEQPAVLVERGWVLMAMGRNAEAKTAASKALAIERTPAALLQSGLLEIERKNNAAGRALLEELIRIAPNTLEAWNAITYSFAKDGQPAAVVGEWLRRKAAELPKSAAAQFALGSWLERTGNAAGAQAALTAALKADPAYAPAAIAAARMKMMQGQWSLARSDVESVLSREPANTAALLALGMIEEAGGNLDAAVKAYRTVLGFEPSNLTALNNLVVRLSESPGAVDEAASLAHKLKQAAPKSLVVDDTVGWALYKQGQHGLAIGYLERAAAGSKKDAQPKYHLAMAYFSAGKKALGHETLKAALDLNPNLAEAKQAKALAESAR